MGFLPKPRKCNLIDSSQRHDCQQQPQREKKDEHEEEEPYSNPKLTNTVILIHNGRKQPTESLMERQVAAKAM